MACYEPGKRSDFWLKLKKDYVANMALDLDLVPVGAWHGSGRKAGWYSPVLLACWNPRSGSFESVCRCMSGFSDAAYRALTAYYREGAGEGLAGLGGGGSASGADPDPAPAGAGAAAGAAEGAAALVGAANAGAAEAAVREGEGQGRLLCEPDHRVVTGERCAVWFAPSEVWQLRGADLTLSPVHRAAAGLVGGAGGRGLGLRFPRFVRARPDKQLREATTGAQLAELFDAQAVRTDGGDGRDASSGGGGAGSDCEFL